MLCHLCHDRPATSRESQLPPNTCDQCLAAIGDIRVWMRESGRTDSMDAAIALRRMDLNSGKELVRR
jgi:hypothetical protein